MFSNSGTSTPVLSNNTTTMQYNINPHHEPLDDTVTWVKDWYSPALTTSAQDDGTSLVESVKLKGWFKTNLNHKKPNRNNYNPNDILDLNQWKYYKGVPITDHSRKSSIVDIIDGNSNDSDEEYSNRNINKIGNLGEESSSTAELAAAISFKNDEGQISGLG
ncbi:uncharacterized protein RJT21DRAFT_40256 [Scheffersomyces amazonensis]|uniref:uncharacterized protein n=1 Tax=Scheffersomyces amazonensis TaxID=1078765 RepID=UPI00315C74A0